MHIVLSYPIMSYNDVKIQLLTCAYHVIVRNYLKYILLFNACMGVLWRNHIPPWFNDEPSIEILKKPLINFSNYTVVARCDLWVRCLRRQETHSLDLIPIEKNGNLNELIVIYLKGE